MKFQILVVCSTVFLSYIFINCEVLVEDVSNLADEADKPMIFTLQKNLTVIYQNVSLISNATLFEMVSTFLNEMKKMVKAYKNKEPDAYKWIRELYLESGVLHLRNIPYGEFIKIFDWHGDDISNFHEIIDDTRYYWQKMIKIMEENAKSDEII
uniref:Uncharacterized protein n=1 Tax=Clastoptera arizonana TaxID=38151 RepID=A0A1B6E9L6_9HEMI